jgi:hypothetical protein
MDVDQNDKYPMAYPVEAVPAIAGVSRTRIFAAIRDRELTARKAGRQTIIETVELQRWISSLPTRGRAPMPHGAAAA